MFRYNPTSKKFHTPTSFRSQRRLSFTPTPATCSLAQQPPLPAQPPLPSSPPLVESRLDISDGNFYNLAEFIKEYGGDFDNPPTQWLQSSNPRISVPSTFPATGGFVDYGTNELVLPWAEPGTSSATLFKNAPPKLKFPAGSRDEDVNKRFLKNMDHYLFQSIHVYNIVEGKRPHPFISYEPLQRYWHDQGRKNWAFRTNETFAMLDAIKANGHSNFYSELIELLWFGGSLSYGNIMRQVYAILYGWIDKDDLPEYEGLCEEDDGISFRTALIKVLRVVRVKHRQVIIDRLYEQLDTTELVMRPGGMAGYFGRINGLVKKMKQQGEVVSDTYLLRRTYRAVKDKHKELTATVSKLRSKAGKSKKPTTYVDACDALIDAFQFEVPDDCKTEKPSVRAAYAGKSPKRTNGSGAQQPGKRPKRVFPKGSCKHCPEAIDHTTKFCYVEKRNKKGCPEGWQWCLVHVKGIHYEHECKRHAPNYPPVPKSCTPCKVATSDSRDSTKEAMAASALQSKVMKMLGLQNVINDSHRPDELGDNKSLKVSRNTTYNPPRPARSVPTNAATTGPPVNKIFQTIMDMSKPDRVLLATRLEKAGF